MSENTPLTFVGFIAIAFVLALIATISMRLGEIHSDKVFEEVFAGAVDVFLEVVVAGGLIWLYQRRQALRAEKAKIARDIREIRAQVREAGLLLTAHQSGKTWGEQSRALIAASTRLEEVRLSLDTIRRDSQSKKAAAHLRNAQSALEKLRDEYRDKHEQVDRQQSQFEQDKKTHPNPDLHAHWNAMLAYLTETNRLLLNENSELLRELRSAAESFKGV
jgi:hypothetical protein